MGLAFGVIIVALIIGCIAGISARNKQNKMIEEGKIIKRDLKFIKNAEEFHLREVSSEELEKAILAFNYGDMGTSMEGNKESQIYSFTGPGWKALLERKSSVGERGLYRFEFTNWSEYRGIPQDLVNTNKLITAIEKMFLSFDSSTTVSSVPRELKTRSKLI